MSDTELLLMLRPSTLSIPRCRLLRLIALSSPVKSLMLALGARRLVNVAISDAVMGSPDALSRAFSSAARRLGSGISTAGSDMSLKVTVTPLLWRAGTWVWMDRWLRGFPHK